MQNNTTGDEEDLSRKLLELEYIRRELENYIGALGSLQIAQESFGTALVGMDKLGASGKEILVPYGQDIFFPGTITDTANAFIGLGNNVFRKLPASEIKGKLKKDLEAVTSNIERTAEVINKLQEQGKSIEEETNIIYERYRNEMKQ
jgi:prefoldin alpha subunit